MFLKTKFTSTEKNHVHIGKGTVAFQGVQMHVHCFVVDGVLIDTGAKTLEKEFTSFFKQQDIEQAVLTHHHEDHTGCAGFIQKELQVPIYMNEKMMDYCNKKADYPLYRKFFWGKRDGFHAKPIGATFSSQNATWDVIETPGHAVDHLVFLNRKTGQLFTGDLYCMERTKVILREESIPTIIESLKKVLNYDFGDVFCSHAGYLKTGRVALQRKLDYLVDLQGQTISLYEKGFSPKTITDMLFPKKYPITHFSSGEWGSVHIINSIIKEYQEKLIHG